MVEVIALGIIRSKDEMREKEMNTIDEQIH